MLLLNRFNVLALSLVLTTFPFQAPSQSSAPQAPSAPSSSPQASSSSAPAKLLLKEGTTVPLKLAQDLKSKYAVMGEPVELSLAEDLKVGDVVVVKKGARVLGTVTSGKTTEKRGDPHTMALRVDFLKAGEAKIWLRGEKVAEGKRNKDAMIAGTIFLGLSGLLMTSGKHYVIPAGTPLNAYVAEEIELPALP